MSVTDSASNRSDSSALRGIIWVVIGGALLLRLLWLGMKPPHFDEGVNGFFIDQMRETGFYDYDPSNYHGPFHFYVLFLMQTLFGRSVEAFRLPLVLINGATLWMIFQFRRFIPWQICAWAAAAFALSPAMVFFSRYAIHEAWLLFALVLTTWGAAELWQRGTTRGLWAVVLGPTLAILTKETYLIHFAAFGLAFITLRGFERWISPSAPRWEKPVAQQWDRGDLVAALSVALLWLVFFYTGGFRDFYMLGGLVQTFDIWSATGVEGAHSKPWHYWLRLMARYELPALAGAALAFTALLPGMNRLIRFLAIWGLGVLVAYAIIPYKTPWCIMVLLWPFYFLLGEAAVRYGRRKYGKVIPLLLALLLAHSLAVSIRLNYFRPTDDKEPYVYAQTPFDLYKLTGPLMKRARDLPTTYHTDIHLLMHHYHPLPWVLGDFTRVYYASKPEISPPEMDAMVIIADDARMEEVEQRVKQAYFVEPFRIFGGLPEGRLYLNAEAFAPYFPHREPELNPDALHRSLSRP